MGVKLLKVAGRQKIRTAELKSDWFYKIAGRFSSTTNRPYRNIELGSPFRFRRNWLRGGVNNGAEGVDTRISYIARLACVCANPRNWEYDVASVRQGRLVSRSHTQPAVTLTIAPQGPRSITPEGLATPKMTTLWQGRQRFPGYRHISDRGGAYARPLLADARRDYRIAHLENGHCGIALYVSDHVDGPVW